MPTPPVGAIWNGAGWDLPQASPPIASPYDGKVWNGKKWIDPATGEVVKPSAANRVVVVVVVLAALAVGALWGLGGLSSKGTARNAVVPDYTVPAAPINDTAWIPSGFQKSPDSEVAFRWVTGADCGYHDTCAAVEVVSRSGCASGVFVEMAQVSPSGTLGATSNEIGPAISAGEKALLTVGWLGDSAAGQVKLTQVSCMG
jgi:hypothetical protein